MLELECMNNLQCKRYFQQTLIVEDFIYNYTLMINIYLKWITNTCVCIPQNLKLVIHYQRMNMLHTIEALYRKGQQNHQPDIAETFWERSRRNVAIPHCLTASSGFILVSRALWLKDMNSEQTARGTQAKKIESGCTPQSLTNKYTSEWLKSCRYLTLQRFASSSLKKVNSCAHCFVSDTRLNWSEFLLLYCWFVYSWVIIKTKQASWR